MINDVRLGHPPSAQQRRSIATMYREHLQLVEKNWRGTAIIASSSLMMGALTALNWLMPPPHPVEVYAHYGDGQLWAFQRLGLPVTQPRPVASSAE